MHNAGNKMMSAKHEEGRIEESFIKCKDLRRKTSHSINTEL
jgi:hypothetical protein